MEATEVEPPEGKLKKKLKVCAREDPDKNAKVGHVFAYSETGNRCRFCNVASENQDAVSSRFGSDVSAALLRLGKIAVWLIIAALTGFGAFFAPMMGLGYRDNEIQFLAIDGTAIATGSDQEDSVDLSNYGVSMGNFMGMRIWKVEIDVRSTEILLDNHLAGNQISSITVRTITSGSTIPDMNDDGVISKLRIDRSSFTTSGSNEFLVKEYGTIFPRGLLIVSDRLYTYYDNNSGSTKAARARVWFTLEKMDESDWREAFEVWRRA